MTVTTTSSRRRFLLSAAAFGGASIVGRGASRVAAREQSENPFIYRRNWGRWGNDDQRGAVNLITPAKRAAAAALVKTGRTVSIGRVFEPEQHFIRVNARGTGHSVVDYYGFMYHGVAVTHVDALSHMWDQAGMWNGRDPSKEIDTNGARFGDITAFGDGLITRGVLLDVPRHRQVSHVALDRPVSGTELDEIARAQKVAIEPGDAVLVHCGREAFVKTAGRYPGVTEPRPGLDSSCARFIRDRDVAVLAWDMHDAVPDKSGVPFPAHGVLYTYGVALVDNALLEPLARACAEERRYEFMFMALPLKIARGTGSPANPIALF
jgi:kynurenine formamidase